MKTFFILSLIFCYTSLFAEENLIINQNLKLDISKKSILNWKFINKKSILLKESKNLKNTWITSQEISKYYGGIYQDLPKLKPSTRYVVEGDIFAESAKTALLQIKFFQNGKETKRMTRFNTKKGQWNHIRFNFFSYSSDLNRVKILCRFMNTQKTINKKISFKNIKIYEQPLIKTILDMPKNPHRRWRKKRKK